MLALVCAVAIFCPAVRAQEVGELAPIEYDAMDGGPPVMESGGGDFFSQDLGTLFRMRYNTESYGQNDQGNLDLGTMQVTSFEDAIGFFDGQLTLNDVQGVGFNLGVGFRWLNWMPFPIEPERITGFSLWADGTSTEGGNFFPQVGVSYESLGDMWDFRVNSYIPIGKETQLGAFELNGEIGFEGNNLSQITVADQFRSFNVGEVEVARRLGHERDAWGFVSPYVLANDEEDTVGYKVGMRGYAYPDLLLQFAVTDDDIFKTNAVFSVVWFVGRTRTDFRPACGLPDRMREPVMRNDYVSLSKEQVRGGIPLTDTNGDAFQFVHVYSDAAPGGDGTFERPYDEISEPNDPGSEEGDIILLWSDSMFTNNSTLVAQDDQRILGEGNDEIFTVTTQEQGVVVIPETRSGARELARPIIIDALGSGAIQLADTNEVANINFTGGQRAIFSPTTGAGNPNLHDFNITGTTVEGIQFTPLTRDNDDDPGTLPVTVAGNVTIDDVVFTDNLGNEININSATTTDTTSPNTTLQETIAISDVTSTNGGGRGIWLRNTHTGRTATILNYLNGTNGTAGSGGGAAGSGVLAFEGDATAGSTGFDGSVTLTNIDVFENTGYALDFLDIDAGTVTLTGNNGLTYDGGTGAAGGIRFRDFDGTFNGNSATITDGTLNGVLIADNGGDNSNGTFNFGNNASNFMFSINSVDTDGSDTLAAFHVNGFTGNLTYAANSTITNDTGRSLIIENVEPDATGQPVLTFNGDITDNTATTSKGVLITDNSAGQIIIAGDLLVSTTNDTAVQLLNNTGTDISINGDTDITQSGTGDGFSATGGGTLSMIGTGNTINSTGSGTMIGLNIDGMTISSGNVRWETVNVNGGTNGIRLVNNTGTGTINVGTAGNLAPVSGHIQNTSGTAIVITDSANVAITGVEVDSNPAQAAVAITKSNANNSTVALRNMDIDEGTHGLNVTGGGTGALNLTVEDSNITDSSSFGMLFTNVDVGTITVNDTEIDGDPADAGAVGVEIVDSDATFNFDTDANITGFDGTDFHVNGGAAAITMNGDITNTSGIAVHIQNTTGGAKTFGGTIANTSATNRSVHIQDNSGGSVLFSAGSTINDDGLGILVEDNSAGTYSFLGTNDLDPVVGATEGVLIDNNTGASIIFAGLNINTVDESTTRGLVAQGGGTLSVTGTTNIIDTENGAGLLIDGMIIGSVDFQRVTVDGTTGPANAIVLTTLTGGQVEIGTTTGAQNSGGVLRSSGDAIVVTNAQNVALRDMQIISAGARGVAVTHDTSATTNMDVTVDGLNLDASTGNGMEVLADSDANSFVMRLVGVNNASDLEENVVVNATGAGLFQMRTANTTINVTGATDAFAASISGDATNVDMILSDTDFVADDANALSLVTSGGTGKTFDLLVENGSFVNSSATNSAADFLASGSVTYNATIRGNSFDNSNAGDEDFTMTTVDAQSRIRLNLGGDIASEFNTAAGQLDFVLTETAGDFDVFEKTDTFPPVNARNNGTVVPVPNAAAFDDTLVAPVVPVIP